MITTVTPPMGQVDVEAPAPGDGCRQRAAEDGAAEDARHADDEAVGGDEERALCQRERDPRATPRRRP